MDVALLALVRLQPLAALCRKLRGSTCWDADACVVHTLNTSACKFRASYV